eukprot:scaffold29732_cov36-Tisochrysis_lutea.AAC.1
MVFTRRPAADGMISPTSRREAGREHSLGATHELRIVASYSSLRRGERSPPRGLPPFPEES